MNKKAEKEINAKERYTTSGIPLKIYYTTDDLENFSYRENLGNPGEYPYTRGIYPMGYRHFAWQQGNIMGFGLPEDTNKRQKYIMGAGAQSYGGKVGMNIAFDNPTVNGYDSDHPLAKYEVGKGGVLIDSLEDMDRLFDGLPLDNMNVGLIIDTPGPIILAMYVALADLRGIPRSKLSGVVRNNPLARWLFSKTSIFPPKNSLRSMVDCIKFCVQELPNMNVLILDGYDCREVGSTAAQEMAYPLAKGIEVIRACLKEGLTIDDFAGKFSFFLSFYNHFFEEIAKIRAGRRVWAKICSEKFGAKNAKTGAMRIHLQTAGSTLTAQEPLNNIARVAVQALGATLAGVQSLSTCSYDEALCIPSEKAVRVAIKTQKIIEHETGICDVADPLGGSYYVETLTNEMEEKIWKIINEIEKRGGFVKAMETGYLEQELVNASFRSQMEIEEGKKIIVGVNKYVENEPIMYAPFTYNPKTREIAVERLLELKRKRDNKKVEEAIENVKNAACTGGSLMAAYIEAAKAWATLGEIYGAVKEVFGEYREETPIFPRQVKWQVGRV